jgi:hypothetical protein
MPVNETIELSGRLRAETDVDLAAVIVNRVLPELFGRGEEELFDALRTPARLAALSAAVDGDVGPIFDAAELAVTLRRTRAGHLATLRKGLEGTDLLYLPEVFARSTGLRFTRQVAEALDEELG